MGQGQDRRFATTVITCEINSPQKTQMTQITDRDKDDYRLNCRFDVKKFDPRTVKPEVFKIRRTEDDQEQGDNTDSAFTVSEMEPALGDYFTITFLESKPTK